MRRRLAVLGALCLLAFPAPPSSAEPVPCTRDEIRLRTLWIEMEPVAKKTFRPGDKVVLTITVTRPAHEDPLGLEQPMDPPESFAAPGIPVNGGIGVGDVYTYGNGAVTDEDGQARLTIKLPRYMGAGNAGIDILAKIKQVDTFCYDLVEEGYRFYGAAFKVRR